MDGTIDPGGACVCSKTYCPYCIKAKKSLGQFLQPNQMEVVEVRKHTRSSVG